MHAKLRTDLLISRVETPEGPRFVIKDPLTSRFFRFREAEYAVVGKLDGVTPLETIAQQLSTEEDQVDVDSLKPFVEQLQRQGLLEGERKLQPPAGFVRGTPLYLRFRAFNPDRLLTFLDRKLGFLFFNPLFVGTAMSIIAWAVFTTIAEADVITRDLRALWNFQSLFMAWLAILGVTTLHEFAHGLTCKHFGGRVNEMGFMLIYFQPAFYCNISDAWLFPEKSRRLWVTAAGGFFELFIWSLATLVWTVVEPDTWVSGLALVIMATSAIKQFFNVNPLIKLDGYYLLSDLLDVPNLRQRAFDYLGRGFRRFFGLTTRADQLQPSRRERTIFAAYGLLAFVFSYWFLATIVLGIGDHLTTQYQGWGFAMFTLFLGLVFPQPIQRLLHPKAATAGAVTVSPSTRRNLWLLAAAVVLGVSFIVPLPLRVGGSFDLLPARNADLRATVAGVIDEIRVDEGDRVARGDTIALLSGRDYLARRRMAAADLEEKRAQLGLLRAGPRKEEIALAEVAVSKAQARLRYAQGQAERTRGLAAIQAASRAQLDSVEEALTDLTKALEQERARLVALRAGSRPEEIEAMKQTVLRSEAEGQRLDEQLAQLVITAPHGGVITTPRLGEKLGAYLEPGDLIAEVHEIDRVRAVIAVSERDIGEVRVGQHAALRLRAYPDRTFDGTVSRIAPAADSGWQSSRMIRVDVDLPNPEGLLRPMMTGYGRIDAGQRRAIDVLTRRLRRFVKVDFWSWW